MRVFTACVACRSRRRRCEVEKGGVACAYCIEHNLKCSRTTVAPFSQQPRRPERSTISAASSHSHTSFLPSQELCLELVDLYFDLIHDQIHSLFHQPTFRGGVLDGTASPVILYAMMALSARFSKNVAFRDTRPWDRGGVYARESAHLLKLDELSLNTIQACILLGAVTRVEGQGGAESVYYSVACRIANLLDLPNRTVSTAIEREVNLRVWWSLCKIDAWSSAGVGLPRQMVPIEGIPLPMDESRFLLMKHHEDTPLLSEVLHGQNISLAAQMILLNSIFMDINDFHTQLIKGHLIPETIATTVHCLSTRLDDWHNSLPNSMQDRHENLLAHGSRDMGRVFVAVHLGYYHFRQLLYYSYLQEATLSTSDPSSIAHAYSQNCKEHAAKLCDLVYTASKIENCKVLYTMVGQNIVIASTVQIHTLMFGTSETEITEARQRLERNFHILTEMRTYWPVLEVSFASFRTFREACRKSMNTAFRMDDWMLRFLYGLAKPVEDKELYEATKTGVWLGENIGISPGDWKQ